MGCLLRSEAVMGLGLGQRIPFVVILSRLGLRAGRDVNQGAKGAGMGLGVWYCETAKQEEEERAGLDLVLAPA